MKQKGFTLIELAIVLIVIGLLLGLGAGLIGILTKRTKLVETREVVKQAREAVLGYAVKYGYLPATLDETGARKLDAWGKELRYYPANELLGSTKYVCAVNATSYELRECINRECSTYYTKSNIAFVVYSTGEDADGNCTGTASPFYIREQGMPYNINPYNINPCTYNPTNPQYYYDDVVAYVSLDEIRSLVGCPRFRITTEFLHYGYQGSQYGAQISVTGGFPNYTWSVTGLPSGLSLLTSGNCSYDSVSLPCTNISPCICGTPTKYGTFPITINVTDSKNQTASKTLSLTIYPSGTTTTTTTTTLTCASCGMYDNYGQCRSHCPRPGICLPAFCGSLLCWDCWW